MVNMHLIGRSSLRREGYMTTECRQLLEEKKKELVKVYV